MSLGPKATSVKVDGTPDDFQIPLAYHGEAEPGGATRLVVSVPTDRLAEVHRALEERGLATTTIATMLTKMERKGVVTHRTERRRFVYRATVEEPAVRQSMVQDVVDRVFAGDRGALVHHLLTECEIDEGELEELVAAVGAP